VIFQVLTAASMKMTVFWAVAPCSLVEVLAPLKCRYTSTRLHGATTQNTAILLYGSVRTEDCGVLHSS
jgi:hypothetical protein